jgi:hypothetical protein
MVCAARRGVKKNGDDCLALNAFLSRAYVLACWVIDANAAARVAAAFSLAE